MTPAEQAVLDAAREYARVCDDFKRFVQLMEAGDALLLAARTCYKPGTQECQKRESTLADIVVPPCSVCGGLARDELNSAAGTLRLVCYKCGRVYMNSETAILLQGAKDDAISETL
jgi:hypothetical protein